ncbi:MAG: xylulokinase [Thermoprotei archaeon]|nr:MAG: xylulokinase [Thermoprotei archaeon]
MSALLGIDLGTTTAKASIFDLEAGRPLSLASREYPTYYPRPGWAEQDAYDWWRVTVSVVREALRRAGVNPRAIEGVCVSSHRESIALVDREGRPLDRVIIWMDRRSAPQAEWIRNNLDVREIYWRTGLVVDPTFTATKLMWIKENNPQVLRKARWALQPKDYIVYRLTGHPVTDVSIASRTMLFDIKRLEWADDLFEDFGLAEYRDLFPEPRFSDEVVGEVSEEAARQTGLAPGIPVVAGGGDRGCEVLGAGVLGPDRVEESTGTGSTTATTIDEPLLDPEMRIVVTVHVIRGKWSVEAGMSTAGAILRWFRDNFAQGENILAYLTRRRAYEYMDMEAEYIPPGSNGLIVLPFFAGARAPRWNPKARGLVFGLTVYHTRAHVFRALMEGVAYEIRKILDVLEELGLRSEEIRLLGGGGKTPTWARIKADVTHRRVALLEFLDAVLVGDAILAGVGVKAFKDYEEGVERLVRIRRVIEPDPHFTRIYDMYYELYEQLVSTMTPFYEKLEGLIEQPVREVPWDIDRLIHLLFKLEE